MFIFFTLQAVIDIGESEFALGLSYVALSRVKAITGLLLIPFSYSRLKPSQKTLLNLEIRNDFLKKLQKWT